MADAAKVAVAAQCDAISARYDALHKSIVLAAPYFESPGVGGTYDLSYTLATTSGPQFGHSSGAITMANGWMIIDLSGAPDVDKHPIVDIAVCRITYTDVCGVIHHYSDTQFVELRGCERLNLLPNADSGVDLLPVCGGSGCGSRCLADGGLPSP